MSQPSCAPLLMYSSILDLRSASESLRERNSTTKSGHRGGNCSCSTGLREFHRSLRIQLASGAQPALLGKMNSVDESKTCPVPSLSAQLPKATISFAFCLPVLPPVGAMTIISPSL